jgi:hypothetical protein
VLKESIKLYRIGHIKDNFDLQLSLRDGKIKFKLSLGYATNKNDMKKEKQFK